MCSVETVEMDVIKTYLHDAVTLNEKIILQIEYILEAIQKEDGFEEEKIRRGCKQLNLVSDVLRDINKRTKEQQTTLANVFITNGVRESSNQWQSKERFKKQISEDIFHSIGQALFSLYLSLYKLNKLEFHEEVSYQLTSLEHIVDDTIKKVKDSAFEIYPLILEDLGIVTTVKSYLAYLSKKELMTIPYEVTGKLHRYSTEAEIQLFRIGQDLFHHIYQHSETSHITISFQDTDVLIQVNFKGEGKLQYPFTFKDTEKWKRRLDKIDASYKITESTEVYEIELRFNKKSFV
ncbi:hypothetical protein ACFYKX_21355 [Cytobacillus sp. FJAT-54145]|uniref:Histidine kinase n=1 Tax=Cytobacillus spartinae TaxID=3299023 RepID=A0ABW6KHR4_9BACI